MEEFLHTNTWLVYICSLIAPFIQEDIAVIGAVTAILTKMGNPFGLFAAISVGLILSDLWKYWLGRAAITQDWARLDKNMFKTIFISRFLPGARIPLYIAAGFFKIPFSKFAASICVTAIFYIGLIYCLFLGLGEIAGERLKTYLPVVALTEINYVRRDKNFGRTKTCFCAYHGLIFNYSSFSQTIES